MTDAEPNVQAYLTHTDGRNAFWTAYVAQKPDDTWRVAVNFGSLLTNGQVQVKDFDQHHLAMDFIHAKINEKLRKGYQHAFIPDEVRIKAWSLLGIGEREQPRTANLLEVCEASVSAAVDAVTGDELTVEQVEAVEASRKAMSELRRRFAELQAQAELIDEMFNQRVGA